MPPTKTQSTNQSDLLGSIFYNFNQMTGWMLGDPSDVDIKLYSDIVIHDGKHVDYITLAEATEPPGAGFISLTYDDTTYLNNVTQEEWEQGDWFLFGIKSLPWFPMPSDGAGGYLRRNNAGYVSRFNKARSSVLTPTLITAAKLTGASMGVYYGTKYGYRYISKRYN